MRRARRSGGSRKSASSTLTRSNERNFTLSRRPGRGSRAQPETDPLLAALDAMIGGLLNRLESPSKITGSSKPLDSLDSLNPESRKIIIGVYVSQYPRRTPRNSSILIPYTPPEKKLDLWSSGEFSGKPLISLKTLVPEKTPVFAEAPERSPAGISAMVNRCRVTYAPVVAVPSAATTASSSLPTATASTSLPVMPA